MNLRPLDSSPSPAADRGPRCRMPTPAWECELLELIPGLHHGSPWALGQVSWCTVQERCWAPSGLRLQRKLSTVGKFGLEMIQRAWGRWFKLVATPGLGQS